MSGFAWRWQEHLFIIAPKGGTIFLEIPKILKLMSEFSSSHQFIFHVIFFILYLNNRSFLLTKNSDIRRQRRIQNAFRSTNKIFSGEIPLPPPPPLTRSGNPSLVLSPLSCLRHSILFSPDHFLERGSQNFITTPIAQLYICSQYS